MVVATGLHLASVATEALEVVTCDFLEDSCHVTHIIHGLQLLYIEPFFILVMPHGIYEDLAVLLLLFTGQGADLVSIMTANNV